MKKVFITAILFVVFISTATAQTERILYRQPGGQSVFARQGTTLEDTHMFYIYIFSSATREGWYLGRYQELNRVNPKQSRVYDFEYTIYNGSLYIRMIRLAMMDEEGNPTVIEKVIEPVIADYGLITENGQLFLILEDEVFIYMIN